MPIYEYICGECSHELEALQKVSDDPLVFCPECGAKSLKKKISAAAFRLKGTGWYETDFKNSDKKKPAEKTGEESSSGAGKAAKDSKDSKDTKPAAKSEGVKSGGKSSAAGATGSATTKD